MNLGHLVLALAVLGATAALAALGTIPGADFFTVVVGIAVGGGVLAGTSVSGAPPSPPPPPSAPPASSPPPSSPPPSTPPPSA